MKYGLLVGTGLLTAFIGLKSIGVVTKGGEDLVALGDLNSPAFLISTASLAAWPPKIQDLSWLLMAFNGF